MTEHTRIETGTLRIDCSCGFRTYDAQAFVDHTNGKQPEASNPLPPPVRLYPKTNKDVKRDILWAQLIYGWQDYKKAKRLGMTSDMMKAAKQINEAQAGLKLKVAVFEVLKHEPLEKLANLE